AGPRRIGANRQTPLGLCPWLAAPQAGSRRRNMRIRTAMQRNDLMRVRRLFNEALEQTGLRRESFLADACGNDHVLHAEIRDLLAAAERSDGFLSDPTIDAPRDPTPPAAPTGIAGTTIGPYKLLEGIGEGGFGTVYMAEQQQPVRRRVALKIIKLGM